ncbi:MAG: DNA replication and repair protein RecF [Rikenellaceae bacterium]
MRLEQIEIIDFRNIKSLFLSFKSKINCFVGENGSGKTNILDAIYYASRCKSLTGATDGQCVNFEADYFMIDAKCVTQSSNSLEQIVCSYHKSLGKSIKRNDKRYARLSQHVGVLPVILVSPYDSALINDAADERRKFLNLLISQIDKNYLNALIKYNSLLQERNKILKLESGELDMTFFEVIDMQLCEQAAIIHSKRGEFIDILSGIVAENYAKISLGRESVSLSFRSVLNERSFDEILLSNFEKDRALGYTYHGVHRDDVVIKIDGHPIKRFGSWGQQKSLLTALKLSEFDIFYQRTAVKPILLLDDIFDKLDMSRVEALLKLVYDDKYGQIFITDSNKTRLISILEGIGDKVSIYGVDRGEVAPVNEF